MPREQLEQRGAVQGVSRASRPQALPDLPRRRRDVAGGGQHALHSDQERLEVRPGRRELVRRDLARRAGLRLAGQAEAPPVGTVGEDADVSAAGLFLAGRQVAGELLDRVGKDAPAREVPLDLDQTTTDLDIDPARTPTGLSRSATTTFSAVSDSGAVRTSCRISAWSVASDRVGSRRAIWASSSTSVIRGHFC